MPSYFDGLNHISASNRKRLYLILVGTSIVLILLLVTVVLLWALPGQRAITKTPTKLAITTRTAQVRPSLQASVASQSNSATPVATTASGSIAPNPGVTATNVPVTVGAMLRGTNMTLFDGSDQVLTSSVTQAALQQMHVGMIRIPMRSTLSEATMIQAAQVVKSIGASPLIILERPESGAPNAVAKDSTLISDMNTVFGNQVVYYEYGNEPDLAGLPGGSGDPTTYIASWNSNVPTFKKLANNARFIGPSMYHYVTSYLLGFLKGAKPLPDYVSWHEYTCSATNPPAYCLLHVDNWALHDATARATMNAAIGSTLPIMITEWNYTADHNVAGDGKHDNAAFMQQWTAKALQSLASNGIYAAMQYSCTDAQIPLINSDNTLSIQGSVFQSSGR